MTLLPVYTIRFNLRCGGKLDLICEDWERSMTSGDQKSDISCHCLTGNDIISVEIVFFSITVKGLHITQSVGNYLHLSKYIYFRPFVMYSICTLRMEHPI